MSFPGIPIPGGGTVTGVVPTGWTPGTPFPSWFSNSTPRGVPGYAPMWRPTAPIPHPRQTWDEVNAARMFDFNGHQINSAFVTEEDYKYLTPQAYAAAFGEIGLPWQFGDGPRGNASSNPYSSYAFLNSMYGMNRSMGLTPPTLTKPDYSQFYNRQPIGPWEQSPYYRKYGEGYTGGITIGGPQQVTAPSNIGSRKQWNQRPNQPVTAPQQPPPMFPLKNQRKQFMVTAPESVVTTAKRPRII